MHLSKVINIIYTSQASDPDLHILYNYLFEKRKNSKTLTEDDLACIKTCFLRHWSKVFDTDNDYTLNPAANETWMKLAQAISEAYGIVETTLLFPRLSSTKEPHFYNKIETITHSKHAHFSDPTRLYFGRDGKTVYTFIGLIRYIVQHNFILQTIIPDKPFTPQAMSIEELKRIRKNSQLKQKSIVIKKKTYSSTWAFLFRKVFPNLAQHVDAPKCLLLDLLDVIKQYYELRDSGSDYIQFQTIYSKWLRTLDAYNIAEVNALYGLKIKVADRKLYLCELLIDLHEAQGYGHNHLDEKLQSIVDCFSQLDASFVLRVDDLSLVYERNGIGPFFTVEHCLALLEQLKTATPSIQNKLNALLNASKKATSISPDLLTAMKELFEKRWQEIKNSSLDYLRLQQGDNQPWIRLAQCLSGAGKITENYYCFLMPDIIQGSDAIQKRPLEHYPLSHYILSSDETQLILLENCLEYQKQYGYLNYYSEKTKKLQSFHSIELDRIQYASEFLRKLLKLDNTHTKARSVSLKTVKAIETFVNDSFFKSGLYLNFGYTAGEIWRATKACNHFMSYYNALSKEEKSALNSHRIKYNNVTKSFSEIIEHIQSQDECITYVLKFCAQFVLNYRPYICFKREIEEHMDTDVMRQNCQLWVLSEYNSLSEQEAKKRCLNMFVSLMTYGFQSLNAYPIDFWDIKQSTNHVGNRIYQTLLPKILRNDYANIRFDYATIIDYHLKRATKESAGCWELIYKLIYISGSNKSWYEDIRHNKLSGLDYQFTSAYQILWFLLTDKKAEELLNGLTDEVIRTLAQPRDNSFKALRVNILFAQSLLKIDKAEATELLNRLNISQAKSFSDCCCDLIKYVCKNSTCEPNQFIQKIHYSNIESVPKLFSEIKKLLNLDQLGLNDWQEREIRKKLSKFETNIAFIKKSHQLPQDVNQSDYLSNLMG